MAYTKNTITYLTVILTAALLLGACSKDNNSGAPADSGAGTGGSLARFTIYGEYLYTVDREVLKTYSLADPELPELRSSISVGMDIETIYPYGGNLFIGSMDALYIYSLENPAKPEKQAMASHLRACDPVVAKGNYAYVTVRSGSTCGGLLDALLVFDVTDLKQPTQLSQVALTNPYGLGIKGNTLYICDGGAGLKVFDVSDPAAPASLTYREGYTFKDCIPHNDILVCMVDQGLVIYDISQANNPIFVTEVTQQQP